MNFIRNAVAFAVGLLIILFCINSDTLQMNIFDYIQKPTKDEIASISSVDAHNSNEQSNHADANIIVPRKDSAERSLGHDNDEYSKEYSEERSVFGYSPDDNSQLSNNSYTVEYIEDYKVEHIVKTSVVNLEVGAANSQTDVENSSVEIVESK